MPPRTRRKQTSKDTTTAKIEPVEANTNFLNDNNTSPTATTAAITTSETETSKEIYAAESIISSNFTNDNNNENDNNNSNIKNNDIIGNNSNDDDDDNAIITNNETLKETDMSKLNISTNISSSEIEINDNNSPSIKAITATTPTAVTPSATEITFADEASKDSNVVVKPSGFTCKRITFDEPSDLNKNSNDLSSELERRKKRAERFGTQLSEADKKLERAARFGFGIPNPLDSQLKSPRPSSTPKKMSIVEDEEKLKKRAERFGLNKSTNETTAETAAETTAETTDPTIKFTSPLSSLSEEEKKRKRAERFSLESKSLSSVSPTSLSTISEEEKMKNRAEKFKTNTNDEPPSKKIKT